MASTALRQLGMSGTVTRIATPAVLRASIPYSHSSLPMLYKKPPLPVHIRSLLPPVHVRSSLPPVHIRSLPPAPFVAGPSPEPRKAPCIDSFELLKKLTEESDKGADEVFKQFIQETVTEAVRVLGLAIGNVAQANNILTDFYKEEIQKIPTMEANRGAPIEMFNRPILPGYCDCDPSSTRAHYCHRCGVAASSMEELDGGKRRRTVRRRRRKTNQTRLIHRFL